MAILRLTATTSAAAAAAAASVTLLLLLTLSAANAADLTPSPTPWPHQFHSILYVNFSGSLSLIDLWYDWTNGLNVNIIQDQLGKQPLYDVEWNNGTSFFYNDDQCSSVQLDVGILRPNWLLDGANYLGQRNVDGFLCNVWEKAEFLWYYEDVVSKRPVHWVFYTGRAIHVMTYEVGAVLEKSKWQAPLHCFDSNKLEHRSDVWAMRGGGFISNSRFRSTHKSLF